MSELLHNDPRPLSLRPPCLLLSHGCESDLSTMQINHRTCRLKSFPAFPCSQAPKF